MKTASLLTLTLIAGAILVVAGTSIEMAYAAANQGAPGQNFGNVHKNPSGGQPPPGQAHMFPVAAGNSGQCQKYSPTAPRAACFPK